MTGLLSLAREESSIDLLRKLGFFVVIVLPAAVLARVITVPLPAFYRDVEVAGYYQTKAILADGAASYTYLSLSESSGGLHLHAALSAPLSAFGVFASGRLVSLASAVIAAALIAWVASYLIDWRVGILATAGAWLHLLYRRLATSWMPEMLGIAMTLGVLAAALKWKQTDERG